MNTESKPKICIFCENEIQLNWVNCPNCGFDLSSWNTFEKNVETYRDFMLELTFDLSTLKETLNTNITNPSTSIIKIFEAIKKLDESKREIIDPILQSKYILLKTIRNQCAHGEKDFKDIKMVGVAFDVLDLLLQECYGAIASYNKQISVFVPPKNWNQMLERINATNLIVISGDPFSGKTTTLYNIARVLSDKGYKIENNVENIKELFSIKKDSKKPKAFSEKWNQKYVFILDDIFGDTQFDPRWGNFWSKKLIAILNNSQHTSKFLVGTRENILNEFYRTNDELQIHGNLDDFKKCVFELGIASYDANDLVEILKNNASFIELEEPKMALLLKKVDMITQNLPGSIYNVLEEVRNTNNFDENSLNRILSENNSGVIFSNRIKRLKDYEKIFLYNLYMNQSFVKDDLEAIYSSGLTSEIEDRNYFVKCVTKFEDYFIKIKIENDWLNFNDLGKKRLEFVHPIYREAIEELINSDKDECCHFEDILNKLYNSVHHQSIMGWKPNDSNYNKLKFNIYQIVLTHYTHLNEPVKDFIIEILNELDFKDVWPLWSDSLELSIDKNVLHCDEADYFEKLFYNYNKFDEVLKNKFIDLLKNVDTYEAVAYCFAYILDSETVIKFQDKLKELSNGNEKVKHLVAKCIIKNYDFIKEDTKKVLLSMGIKTTVMQYLIHNYDLISNDLKNILLKQIQSATEGELIETGEAFLVNYRFFSKFSEKQRYDLMFNLKNELITKEVWNAFSIWFAGAFSDLDYDEKREIPDKKVLELYCKLLKDEKIVRENFVEMVSFYNGCDTGTLSWSIIYDYRNKEKFSNKMNPKWDDPFYSELKKSLEINMILLLGSTNQQKEDYAQAYVYCDAFFWYLLSGNGELFNKIKNILDEYDNIKIQFLEFLNNGFDFTEINSNDSFKMKKSQIDIIDNLSKPPNHPTIRAKANEILNYINSLIDKHIIEVTKDDYC